MAILPTCRGNSDNSVLAMYTPILIFPVLKYAGRSGEFRSECPRG